MSFPQDFRRKTDGGGGECGNCGKVEKLWKSGNGQKRLLVSAKVDGMRKSFAAEKVAGNPAAASKTKAAESVGKSAAVCGSSRRFGEGGIPAAAF